MIKQFFFYRIERLLVLINYFNSICRIIYQRLVILVNRQGIRLAFSCQAYANLSIQETVDRQATEKTSGSLVYKFDKSLIRYWNEYMLGPRHHPFVVSIQQDTKGIFNFTSTLKDVLFNVDSDSPTRPFGDGRTQ
jgi:hypothetical protein